MILLIILTIALIGSFFGVERLNNRGHLTKRQYQMYIILLLIGMFAICGQLQQLTNTID